MYYMFLARKQKKDKELPKDMFRVFQHKLSCHVSSVGKPKAQAHEAGSLEPWPEPRLIKFHQFLKIEHVLAKGMTVIQTSMVGSVYLYFIS